MSASSIYFDNNATTPLFPEVLQCMMDAFADGFANPGSQHSYGREARRILEDSRESIAGILNADASEVIFTSGGTESINMAIYGFTFGRTGTIALTAGEHPATLMACEKARQQGWQIVTLNVDQQGRLDETQWSSLPWADLKLVCVILAHNETGVIQDVSRLASLCRSMVPHCCWTLSRLLGKRRLISSLLMPLLWRLVPTSFMDLAAWAVCC